VVALSDQEDKDAIGNSRRSRQNIRQIMDDENLTEETKNALVEERERKKRIEEKHKLEREALVMTGAGGVVEDVFLDIES
jgi:hypothetical protein